MKLPAVIITITVAVISLTMVLMPVLEDAQHQDNTLDVIIIDGQSNAAYYTSDTTRVNPNLIDLPVPHHKLMYYGTETGPNDFLTGDDPDGIYEMNRNGRWVIGGLEPTLSYYYSERSGNDVLTINVARGAQSITSLAPDGEYWQLGSQLISDALSMVSGYSHVNMVGWVMLQGEQDKDMDVDTYKEHFLDLADYFDSIGATQCYLVKTREYYGGNATIAQAELVEEDSDIHMATTITDTFTESNGYLVTGDPLHYSQRGRNVVGEAVGNAMEVYSIPGSDILSAIPVIIAAAILLGAVGVVGSMMLKRE